MRGLKGGFTMNRPSDFFWAGLNFWMAKEEEVDYYSRRIDGAVRVTSIGLKGLGSLLAEKDCRSRRCLIINLY